MGAWSGGTSSGSVVGGSVTGGIGMASPSLIGGSPGCSGMAILYNKSCLARKYVKIIVRQITMRNLLVIIVVGFLVALGTVAYFMNQGARADMPSDIVENVDNPKTYVGGKYITYSAESSMNFSGRRVLFFYANWCPTCRPADVNIRANEDKLPEDLTVVRVNYNDTDTDLAEKALAQKYGVTYQHTFVQIDTDGAEIAKWNGGALPELLENIK